MNSVNINIKLYDLLRKKMNVSEDVAIEFVQAIDSVVKEEIKSETKEDLATRSRVKEEIYRLELKIEQTKGELTKAIYWAGLIQFLAVLGGVIAILKFMMKQ